MNRGVDGFETPWPCDADELLHRLVLLRRAVDPGASHRCIEVYHRASWSRRVGRTHRGPSPSGRVGSEAGFAVRVRGEGGGLGFAACSGADASGLQWALTEASRSPHPGVEDGEAWFGGDGEERVDRDDETSPPSERELSDWLGRAWGGWLDRASRAGRRLEPVEAWVEAATTTETWVGDGGLVASRVRTRAWALIRLRGEAPGQPTPKPILIAGRNGRELPEQGWWDVHEDRRLPTAGALAEAPGSGPVLFNPESSATLVQALVRALHNRGHGVGFPVGPAWIVANVPGDPEALYGGRFDDAGFPTERKLLADGKSATGLIEGPGHYRRPSFRNPPVALPAHLVVEANRSDPPPRATLVCGLTLHPLDPDCWVLEVEGARLESGRPGGRIRRALIEISPGKLVQRCVAAIGPARLTHRGVRSPALVFDDLELS